MWSCVTCWWWLYDVMRRARGVQGGHAGAAFSPSLLVARHQEWQGLWEGGR